MVTQSWRKKSMHSDRSQYVLFIALLQQWFTHHNYNRHYRSTNTLSFHHSDAPNGNFFKLRAQFHDHRSTQGPWQGQPSRRANLKTLAAWHDTCAVWTEELPVSAVFQGICGDMKRRSMAALTGHYALATASPFAPAFISCGR